MVKRIDDDSLLDIEHPKMFLEAMRFVDKNKTAIADKMGGRRFYFCNKAISRVGLNDEDRKELAALKRSVDEVKVKKHNNVINLKTAKVIR